MDSGATFRIFGPFVKYLKRFFILFTFLPGLIAWAESDLDLIHQRITQRSLEQNLDETEIEQIVSNIRPDGTWPGIDYEVISRTSYEHWVHAGNLVKLARAYKSPNSAFYEREDVLRSINLGLRHWANEDYEAANWWFNQIGVPSRFVEVLLLVGDELDPDLVTSLQPIIGRAHVEAPGARPGGDRIKIAAIQAKHALLRRDLDAFEAVIEIIEGEIKITDWVGLDFGFGSRYIPDGLGSHQASGRGIQHDLSFKHRADGANNTLSYGISYAAAFAEWASYLVGTNYAFSEEKIRLLIDYFLDGISKMTVFGTFPDPGAVNRSLSRPGRLQIYSSELPRQLAAVTRYRRAELAEIIAMREQDGHPTLSHATHFWLSDHVSVQRPDWYASVRLFSSRIHNTEWPYNSEGLLDHHRTDGANFLTVRGNEYDEIWPVYDFQKIPGASIVQRLEPLAPDQIQKRGLTDFVGATTDDIFAAVAFDFRSPHSSLVARKSWFFFEDQYVCLGAGISSRFPERSVVTTLSQKHLCGNIFLQSNGEKKRMETGDHDLNGVDWVHHGQVGYTFFQPTSVRLFNDSRTGAWQRISQQSSLPDGPVEAEVFQLWLDHGVQPSEASYAYVVYPAINLENFEAQVAGQNITVLANTPELQAVRNAKQSMGQAVFYNAGQVELFEGLDLHASAPCIVILRAADGGSYRLTVSDPNRELSHLHLRVSAEIDCIGEAGHVFWNASEQMSELLIQLPQGQFAGTSVTVQW
jgi:chondroitin AC lyase